MEKIRLQKILSRRGYGSRRDCEKLISSGRVTINGKTADLGDKGNLETDEIGVDGKILEQKTENYIFIALNKPVHVLSDIKKTDKRVTARELIGGEDYLFIVGRLDYRSEGLLLFTNHGELANRLTHPRYEHEKEYLVILDRGLTEQDKLKWEKGLPLNSEYETLSVRIQQDKKGQNEFWYRITMREGKKRQIRESARILGYQVRRLIRIRIANIELGDLAPGKWRRLTSHEIKNLLASAGLEWDY